MHHRMPEQLGLPWETVSRWGDLVKHFSKQLTVRGSQIFLKMCPPFLSLLVSALFRWPCSISILNYFLIRCVRPFCHCWCPPFSAGHAPFLFICLPGDFFTLVSQVRCLLCWCPPLSAGHAACCIHLSPT